MTTDKPMTMVERVARALWDSLEGDTHSGGGWDFGTGPMNVSPEQKDRFRKMARAALEAMREPTDEILAAIRQGLRDGGLIPAYTDKGGAGQLPILHTLLREKGWPAAIDAALKE